MAKRTSLERKAAAATNALIDFKAAGGKFSSKEGRALKKELAFAQAALDAFDAPEQRNDPPPDPQSSEPLHRSQREEAQEETHDEGILANQVAPEQPTATATAPSAGISNDDFIAGIFGSPCNFGDPQPLFVSFMGNPKEMTGPKAGAWAGKIRLGFSDWAPAANNYFSIATFDQKVVNGEGNIYKRRKGHFHALHAVVLDDVGTKVPAERVTLPPSWALETSSGNYQVGFILAEPIAEAAEANALVNSIIAAGLCDEGADGPTARIVRLPVGSHGGKGFQCRLAEWKPERRYATTDLIAGLQVDPVPDARAPVVKTRPRNDKPQRYNDDEVMIPRPTENAVVVALRDRGLYKAPLGDGKHDITCPWVHEHTDGADGGTAYFEPDDSFPIGGFKCLHGHCAHRHIRTFLEAIGVEVSAARMKPTIRIVAGEIHRIVDVAEQELANSGRHYQRGGLIVTVTTDPGTRETQVQTITLPMLTRVLSGVATWEKFDARKGDWVRADPPERHVGVLLNSPTYPHMPILAGIARQPYLRPDGSLMMSAGYDAATGMFGVFDARQFAVPEQPTKEDAQAALVLLLNLLTEFVFASPTDRAAALTAMLTGAIRPSLPTAPCFHAQAHMAGSGKSYLCELVSAFTTPQKTEAVAFPGDDEECRKLLLSQLLTGPAVIQFDNLTGDLKAYPSLCSTLTSEFISSRILGVSKTATVGTRALFLSSGNNVGPVGDMTRRTVTIHLNPEDEVPAARTFVRPGLVNDVLINRGRYVSAALTIIRAWITAGRPMVKCNSLASYGMWSELCRQPIMWLGQPDPTASVFTAMTEDPDRETLARLLHAWRHDFGHASKMVRDAVTQAIPFNRQPTDLGEVFKDIADERGRMDLKRLGWWLKKHAGRVVDGLRLVRDGSYGNTAGAYWKVEEVQKKN